MVKKIFALLLASLVLSGCNGPSSSSENKDSEDDSEVVADDAKKLLPSSVTINSSLYMTDIEKIEFSYFDDLHGYLKTRVVDYGDDDIHYKTEEKFIYSEDFKKCEYLKTEYDFNKEKNDFVLDIKIKEEREFLENGSYKVITYEFDETENKFFYKDEKGITYNERGQILLRYTKHQNEEDETKFYYYDYQTYEYDEEGFELKYCSYDYKEDTGEFFVDYYNEFTYDQPNHAHCRVDSYYWVDDKYENDGYELIDITNEDGIIVFDRQSYYDDGELGNHNVTKYTEDFYPTYTMYGGMSETTSVALNEYNQIVTYFYEEEGVRKTEGSAVYGLEGKEMTEATLNIEYSLGTYTYNTVFERSSAGQIENATSPCVYIENAVEPIHETYDEVFTVTYSNRIFDKLYDQMDFENELVDAAAGYYFVERIA